MQFERPGKFRWVYEKPYEQLIVGDGARIWFYDHDLNQVTVRKLDVAIGSSPAALLAGSSDIETDFDLTEIGLQGDTEWLEARPKAKESTFEWVRLGFTPGGSTEEQWSCTIILVRHGACIFPSWNKTPNLRRNCLNSVHRKVRT